MVTDNVVYSSGENRAMEKSRSWPSAHDWKSCIPQKGIEGSNPSFSAIKRPPDWVVFFLDITDARDLNNSMQQSGDPNGWSLFVIKLIMTGNNTCAKIRVS